MRNTFRLTVGWFNLNDAASGGNRDVGTDIYVQGKYMFGDGLNIELGADYASLGKGHFDTYASASPKSRSVTLFFSRLQLEY